MDMKQWISIDQTPFRKETASQLGNVTVTSSSSPYSVPEAVSSYDDKSAGVYILEVRYIGSEEPKEAIISNNLTFLVGKNSKRLFAIEVPYGAKPTGYESAVSVFTTAMQNVGRDSSAKIENYQIVNDVIAQIKDRLFVSSLKENQASQK